MESVEKPKAKRVKKKKTVKEYNNSLAALIDSFKGYKIICDDAVFNLGVRG